MGGLLAARRSRGGLFPVGGWSEAVEVEERAAVQDRSRGPEDSSQAHHGLFVDFVSAHQVGVVAEIAQEPAQFPQGPWGAVEPAGDRMALVLFRFENSEPQNVERSLRMPAIEGSIDANQEDALQDFV